MKHITIIGAGQIGRRHLESLMKLTLEYQVSVIDPNPTALKIAKKTFVCREVNYFADPSNLPGKIDLAIIATTANVRLTALKSLLSHTQPRYILLEKVLFQDPRHYQIAKKMLADRKIKAWVNHICRSWPFYQKLKKSLSKSRFLEMRVSGSNWGLGCNSIHYLDLISYLSGLKKYTISSDFIDSRVIQSKRKGFIEFTGSLVGKFDKGPSFGFASFKEQNIPVTTEITTPTCKYFICENQQKAYVAQNQNMIWKEINYSQPYLSAISHRNIEEILIKGESILPTLEESIALHLPMIKSFLRVVQRTKKGAKTCPIT